MLLWIWSYVSNIEGSAQMTEMKREFLSLTILCVEPGIAMVSALDTVDVNSHLLEPSEFPETFDICLLKSPFPK